MNTYDLVVCIIMVVCLVSGFACIVSPRLWRLAYVELVGYVVMFGLCTFRFCSVLSSGGWGVDYAIYMVGFLWLVSYPHRHIRNRLRLKKAIERAIALSKEAP